MKARKIELKTVAITEGNEFPYRDGLTILGWIKNLLHRRRKYTVFPALAHEAFRHSEFKEPK